MNRVDIIGKTLREVKALHSDVRVTAIGDQSYIGTCDYRPDRLNVKLSPEGLEFEETRAKFDWMEEELVEKHYKDIDEGVVVSFSWG